ncbi:MULTISPECIES: stage II sporulation protein E [Alteribacter]|uniref:Stage II sporulation protein E n=1 Tax=Alteribacter keqinensis TaxID=2483800 RepID=A0A3M7TKM7_9BACI|nr:MULTISPECIES: stage II sporulation protein E [Alteribacter]MBM7097950.1 stage II sporulation protein E [Alteribacter salitolerans]RNA66032.1 stage II sporulation protein E [Alteribacter keqinensis]
MLGRLTYRATSQTSAIPIPAKPFSRLSKRLVAWLEKPSVKDAKRTFWIILIGFLLGRAVILMHLLPFAVPFLAVMLHWQKSKAKWALLAIWAGAATISVSFAAYAVGATIAYLILHRIITVLRPQSNMIPMTVFITVAAVRFSVISVQEGISSYGAMIAGVEAGLALVVTLIFFQSIPILFERKNKMSLRHEEVVSIVIFLASVMTGTVGWLLYNLSVEFIIARYLVLVFAFVGGAAIGSTVGVVVGLILSLANVANLFHMSLLAFSGLLGGLLKEGKKIGVCLGLLIGTGLMGMYGDNQTALSVSMMETGVAIAIFLLTPKKWIEHLARYIPGTAEHAVEQQQYLRKIRDLTAGKVEQFSRLFYTLSNSFSDVNEEAPGKEPGRDVDLFLSKITEKTCQTCMKKHQCWTRKFSETYNIMERTMQEIEDNKDVYDRRLMSDLHAHCIKHDKVIRAVKDEIGQIHANKQLRKQIMESRRLVADQLRGVSKVMEDFAKDIQREQKTHELQEDQISESLLKAGIPVEQVEVYSLDNGNVDIEMIISHNEYNEGEKVIAPLLSHILKETIVVKHTEKASLAGGAERLVFGSAKQYVVSTGASQTAKGGKWISGDSYSTMELGAGKYALAISDGMGNGKRAHLESNDTIELLKNILRSGIEETVAIKSINSVLALRSEEEMFSTLDLVMIDMQDASAKFLKVGSIPSFLKRGRQVKMIESGNLPIGMITDVEVDVVNEQLKSGDLLIMMSDGIFDGPANIENREVWMKRVINEMKTNDPQEVADLLMERVIREGGGIHDDMTVVVARIDHHLPKWATIPVAFEEKAFAKSSG